MFLVTEFLYFSSNSFFKRRQISENFDGFRGSALKIEICFMYIFMFIPIGKFFSTDPTCITYPWRLHATAL